MISIPEEYTVSKFFQYIYQPRFNKFNNTYQGGCCICREGGSLGKKRRCYYIPKNDNIFCLVVPDEIVLPVAFKNGV